MAGTCPNTSPHGNVCTNPVGFRGLSTILLTKTVPFCYQCSVVYTLRLTNATTLCLCLNSTRSPRSTTISLPYLIMFPNTKAPRLVTLNFSPLSSHQFPTPYREIHPCRTPTLTVIPIKVPRHTHTSFIPTTIPLLYLY